MILQPDGDAAEAGGNGLGQELQDEDLRVDVLEDGETVKIESDVLAFETTARY